MKGNQRRQGRKALPLEGTMGRKPVEELGQSTCMFAATMQATSGGSWSFLDALYPIRYWLVRSMALEDGHDD